jgi:hypothetical protein
MRPTRTPSPILRWVVTAVGLLLVAYLAVLGLQPSIVDALPSSLGWFGRPGSMPTLGIVVTVLIAARVLTFRSDSGHRLVGVSFTVIAVLISMSAVLGLSSYWGCHDANHPAFFTPLMATAQLVKGGIGDYSVSGRTCPNPTPVGLELARIAALSAIFPGLGGVVVGVFRSQVDRLRANLADSVTAIVGVDDDTQSMISGIARTLDRRTTLVVITSAGDDRVQRARRQGARVLLVDFNNPSTLVSLHLWRHLNRLYLMSPDPAINLLRLDLISRRLAELGHKQRLPLIVRMDDPWLAEAWRAQQFGGSDTRFAADVVGKYEVTAGRRRHHRRREHKARIRLLHFAIDTGVVLGPDPARPGTRLSTPHPARPRCPRSPLSKETLRSTCGITSFTVSKPDSCPRDRPSTRSRRRRRYRPCSS